MSVWGVTEETMTHPKSSPVRRTSAQQPGGTRDRLPSQVFTRGTSGAVKTHAQPQGAISFQTTSDRFRSRSQTARDRRERSSSNTRPPNRRRSTSAQRRFAEQQQQQPRTVRSRDSVDNHTRGGHSTSSSDQGSAASTQSYATRGRHTPTHSELREPPIKRASPHKKDFGEHSDIDSQKEHVKTTKKVIDGTCIFLCYPCLQFALSLLAR